MYRFRHQGEDAADGCVSYVPVADMSPWPHPCFVCGQAHGNTLDWNRCVVCNEPRGTWQCGCGHLNPQDADDCQTCGREKPCDT